MSTLLRAPRIVTADADLRDGWLLLDDDDLATVLARGTGEPPAHDRLVERDGTVVPAFVDVHAHGALGADFATCEPDSARAAADHHASRGTADLVASVATGALRDTVAALGRLAPLVADGTLAGIHLEGPYLSPVRRGAHAAALLRSPDLGELDTLLAAAGTVRIVTLAPELPGGVDAVRHLVAAGVVVAIGHTDADADTVARAIDAGASLVTHLCNGMPPLHHRRPGPVGVALADDRVAVELIVDGHHLDPVTVDLVRRAAGDRMLLVSDAMAATGLDDGPYTIAGSDVVVTDGVAMLADGSSLAGSTITVGDAVDRLLAEGRSIGTDAVREAVAASSVRAARLLGLPAPLTVGAPGRTVLLGPAPGLPAAAVPTTVTTGAA